ncbi:hypothetical protein TREMEDRAFT_65896 [Tremella mesenterica DSM 1558]|uniref:uncharacterized protein n=1 Tax=Tremella mesenterica (strain ATCC 24925 / CBS 8224 / DSM 1558 / NBRC 9311 / NRRL Y-6157 / RJB 2259-6 / UBC 559-6) TaxID=578456 RepID=UPI00032CAEC7|nr:uncharacterized protein TREMEDRAFT_65896 [Tremella mesenterica DSM 1558]EIW66052.1 hypothetical protein TREMEDRAFT_65896 [Tremella mesenterica DSM 1558]
MSSTSKVISLFVLLSYLQTGVLGIPAPAPHRRWTLSIDITHSPLIPKDEHNLNPPSRFTALDAQNLLPRSPIPPIQDDQPLSLSHDHSPIPNSDPHSQETPVSHLNGEEDLYSKRSMGEQRDLSLLGGAVTDLIVDPSQIIDNSTEVACAATPVPYGYYYIKSSSTGNFLALRSDGGLAPDASEPYAWSVAELNSADNDGQIGGTVSVVAACSGARRTLEAPGTGNCICPKWDPSVMAEHWAVMYSCAQPPVAFSKTLWFFNPNKDKPCGSSFSNVTNCQGTFELIPTNHMLDNQTLALSSSLPGVQTEYEEFPWGGQLVPWSKGDSSQEWEVWNAWA